MLCAYVTLVPWNVIPPRLLPEREAKARTKLMRIYSGMGGKTPATFRDDEQALEEGKRRLDLPQNADQGWRDAKHLLAQYKIQY